MTGCPALSMATALSAADSQLSLAPSEAPASFDGLEASDEFSRFLVVGGGLGGLSAASHLARQPGVAPAHLRLLEARNRLGGRILTAQMGGHKAELGASWIHGVLGNPLYEMAASRGLVDPRGAGAGAQQPHNVAAVTEDGRRLPFSVLQVCIAAVFPMVLHI